MIKYEINNSKLIFDINKLRRKINNTLYKACLEIEQLEEGVSLTDLTSQQLLSLRACLAYNNYSHHLQNQKIVEEIFLLANEPVGVFWHSLKEFRLRYWKGMRSDQLKLIEIRTKQKVCEHLLSDHDGTQFYYYTLERNHDEVLCL